MILRLMDHRYIIIIVIQMAIVVQAGCFMYGLICHGGKHLKCIKYCFNRGQIAVEIGLLPILKSNILIRTVGRLT